MDGESNENEFNTFGMSRFGERMKYKVEMGKLSWFDHMKRMPESNLMKRVYV